MRRLFYNYARRWRQASSSEAGFTMVELLVVIVVLGILTPVVIGTLGDIYSWNTTSLGQNSQNTYTKGALHSIESDVAYSRGWTDSLALAVPWAGPTNSSSNETWSYCGIGSTTTNCTDSSTINRVLIVYTTATDKVSTDSSRLPIYAKTSGTCDYTKTVKVAKIYFVAPDASDATKNDLYRRTIVNPDGSQAACDGTTPYQATTCARAVASNCGSRTDTVLARNVKTFDVDYFANANDTSQLSYNTASSSDITGSDAIVVTLTTEMNINGDLSQQTASIRMSTPVGTNTTSGSSGVAQLTGVTYSQSNVYPANTAATYQYMNDNNANGSTNNNQTATLNGTGNYLTADAGSTKYIDHIVIGYDYLTNLTPGWGTSPTQGLQVQGSTDNSSWTTIATTPTYASSGSTNGLVPITINGNWRYIRLAQPASFYLVDLEFQLWGY